MTRTNTPALRSFEADLIHMLSRAAAELEVPPSVTEPRRRRALLRAATVIITALCLAVAVPILSDDPLRGALAVRQSGNSIIVSVKDASADPDAMTRDLRAHGLPANVEVVPVSPSLEGTWVDIVNDNLDAGYNDPRIVDVFEQIAKHPVELELPADFSTPFTLVVGRPALPGETYQISHERDVVGAYACLGLEGLSPAEADATIRRQGYEPLWYFHRADIPQTDVLDSIPTDKVVFDAEFLGPTTVIVHVADPDSEPAETSRRDSPRASC